MSGPQDSAASEARDSAIRSDADARAAADGAGPNAQTDGQSEAKDAPGAAASAANDGSGTDGGSGEGAGPDEPQNETQTGHRRPRKQRSFWRELPILVAVALLLAVLIKTYAIQAFYIPSGSMENTLIVNDRVLVNKIVYHTRDIHRGDIVVFNGDGSWDPGTVPVSGNIFEQFGQGFASMFGFGRSGDILIKRVIGIPGDNVACCDSAGRVTVNGVPLIEQSYLYPGSAPSLSRFNIKVPPGRLWVMGDNRFYSADSRDHQGDPGGGTIPESAVIGRAFVIIWPPSRWSILPIPATFQEPALNNSHAAAPSAAGSADSAAGVLSARAEPTGQTVPLALGFAGAIPLTWLQRRVRTRIRKPRRGRPDQPRQPRRAAAKAQGTPPI